MTNLNSLLKNRHHFADKGLYSQSYGFSSSHVWMWELGHKEYWALKNWCIWTVVLEKTLESPLDCKEIKPVNPKWNQPWICIGRTDAEAETSILWPPDMKTRLTVYWHPAYITFMQRTSFHHQGIQFRCTPNFQSCKIPFRNSITFQWCITYFQINFFTKYPLNVIHILQNMSNKV